jgi:hypothetical protein
MSVKKLLLLFPLYSVFMICNSCKSSKTSTASAKHTNQALFWNQIKSYCGKSFKGTVVEAPDTDTTFRGKELIIHLRSCEENRIRIPFIVGTNRSRTFILKRFEDKLEWKHDHRHNDGKPEEMTMYGGTTTNTGSETMQIFPVDQQSTQLRPAGFAAVWWVEIDPGKSLTYNLRAMGKKLGYVFKFDLTRPVETPLAPWGWTE